MSRLKILLDLDGVCANLDKKWYAMYNAEYDDDLCPADIKDWNTSLFVKPECGRKIFDYLRQPGFFADLEPIEGAIEGVAMLCELGDVFIVSSSAEDVDSEGNGASDKIRWVHKYFPNVTGILIVNGTSKLTKSIVFGDILIDDGPHNLEHSPATWKIKVDFGYGYNKHAVADYTAHTWFDIVRHTISCIQKDADIDRMLESVLSED
jgi:5'-nucleotidase